MDVPYRNDETSLISASALHQNQNHEGRKRLGGFDVSGRLGSIHPTAEHINYCYCYDEVGRKKRQVHGSVLPVARPTEQWDVKDGRRGDHWSVAQAVDRCRGVAQSKRSAARNQIPTADHSSMGRSVLRSQQPASSQPIRCGDCGSWPACPDPVLILSLSYQPNAVTAALVQPLPARWRLQLNPLTAT